MIIKPPRRRRPRQRLTAPLRIQASHHWPIRLLRWGLIVASLAGALWLAYLYGRLSNSEFQGITVHDVLTMRSRIRHLALDNATLLRRETRLQQERLLDGAAETELERQQRIVQRDNDQLRQQLGLFEQALARADHNSPLQILRIGSLQNSVGTTRIWAILTQGRMSNHSFRGYYRWRWQAANGTDQVWPEQSNDLRGQLNFRSLTRIEADLPARLPRGGAITLELYTADQATPVVVAHQKLAES